MLQGSDGATGAQGGVGAGAGMHSRYHDFREGERRFEEEQRKKMEGMCMCAEHFVALCSGYGGITMHEERHLVI